MSHRQVLEGNRTCTRCGKTQPWQEFSVDRRDADGNVIRVKNRCRKCLTECERNRRRAEAANRERMNGRGRIPEPWEWVKTKRCSVCREMKSWALFSPVCYWPDGMVRRVQSQCRACRVKAQRNFVRQMTPKRRAYLARWKASRARRLKSDREGRGEHLPVESFRAWLVTIEREEGGLAKLSEDAGLHSDTLSKVMTRNKVVSLTTAERAACARGLRLDDIYIELRGAA